MGAPADSEKNRGPISGMFVFFAFHVGASIDRLRSILWPLGNLRPTMIRGLMTDEEWAIFAPFLITASSRGGPPTLEPSAQAGRHTLDLPEPERHGATCRRRSADGTRCGSNSAAGVSLAPGTSCFRRWLTAACALDILQMIDSTIVRAHRCAAGEKTEEQNQALGRCAVGSAPRSTCVANAAGLPIGIVLSEGEAHDVTAYDGFDAATR